MLDHIILTVSDVERSLAFYEAALKPLYIKFFMPYKGKDGHPDLWGFGDGKKAFFWIKQRKPDPGFTRLPASPAYRRWGGVPAWFCESVGAGAPAATRYS